MDGYTKVFSSILDSTVWALSKEARILWITMLVKKNRAQKVMASLPGLAHAARLTIAETEAALRELAAPDPYSQSKESDGRRVEQVPGGWFIINGMKYRDMMSAEDRREYQRVWVANRRSGKKRTSGAPGKVGSNGSKSLPAESEEEKHQRQEDVARAHPKGELPIGLIPGPDGNV